MKKIMLTSIIVLFYSTCRSQGVTFYTNTDLTKQVALNYAFRTASEKLYNSRAEKIREKTENIKNQYAKVVIVKEYVHNTLVNISQGLKQSKQVLLFDDYILDTYDALNQSLAIASKRPELILFCEKRIGYITNSSIETYDILHKFVLKADKELLLDHNERQKIIDDLRARLIILRGQSYALLDLMEYRNNFSIIDNGLDDWLLQDKFIAEQILRNYSSLKM